MSYLENTKFDSPERSVGEGYEVEIDDDGLYVYSECCGDRMSMATLRKVVEAGGRFLADRDRVAPAEPDPNEVPLGGQSTAELTEAAPLAADVLRQSGISVADCGPRVADQPA
jgi:hypothetical protein